MVFNQCQWNTEISHIPIAPEIAEEQLWGPNMTLGEDYKYVEFNNLQRNLQAQVGGISWEIIIWLS